MKQAVSFGASTDSSRWCREAMDKLYWRTNRADAKQHRMTSAHIATTTTRPRLRLVVGAPSPARSATEGHGDVSEKADEPSVAMVTLGQIQGGSDDT